MILILLLLHLGNRRIIRLNIYFSLKTVDDDRLAFVFFFQGFSQSDHRWYSFGSCKHSRMGIDSSISGHKSKNFALIKLYSLTWIKLSRSKNKRLIRQHLIFPCPCKNPEYSCRYILYICLMPLHIILITL